MDIPDRPAVEASFARTLARLSAGQRRLFAARLGSPPDFSRLTPDFWVNLEHVRQRELSAQMSIVYLLSADEHAEVWLPDDLHAMTKDSLRSTAATWADAKSREIARKWLTNTQQKFDKAMQRLAGGFKPPGAPGIPGFPFPSRPPTAAEVEEELIDIFSPERDALAAATETTRAATGGFHGARGAAEELGIVLDVIWWTEADGRVCPWCQPLHRQSMKNWESVLIAVPDIPTRVLDDVRGNGGPPAHVNCRCWLETVKGGGRLWR